MLRELCGKSFIADDIKYKSSRQRVVPGERASRMIYYWRQQLPFYIIQQVSPLSTRLYYDVGSPGDEIYDNL